MTYQVRAADLAHIRVNEQDTVSSVLQNVAVILSTKKGTVPLYRDFGLSWRSVDKPIPIAKVMLYTDVKEAIEEYEPRASVVNVTFREDSSTPGGLIPIVEVEINE